MLIPIGVDRPKKRPTVITYWLIAVCILVSLAELLLLRFNVSLHEKLFEVTFTGTENGILLLWPPGWDMVSQPFRFWQLFTSQFLHADLLHLLGNMLFLFVFGPAVEDRLGRIGFLAFYLLGGAAAGGMHMLAGGEQTVYGYLVPPALGASGAISAVTGAFLVMFPKADIKTFFLFFLLGVFTIPAWWFIAGSIALDIFWSASGEGTVAYEAHLGGYFYGALISVLLLWRRIIPREPYDLFTMGKQARRRRQFRELTTKPMSDRVWDAPRGAKDGKEGPKPRRVSARGEAEMKARGAVHESIEAGDLDEAARRYLKLVDEFGAQCLTRDGQLAVANHLHASGDHQHAALAYRQFTDRYRADAETNRVRLMHAVLLARYLNDPIGAERELDAIENHKLSSDEADLASTLREELA
ncbi:MAG: rhomboid family intramembrane serine protease [Phycisphaerales bacterium]